MKLSSGDSQAPEKVTVTPAFSAGNRPPQAVLAGVFLIIALERLTFFRFFVTVKTSLLRE